MDDPVLPPPLGVRSLLEPPASQPPQDVASPDVPPPPTEVRPLHADPPPLIDAPTGLTSEESYATLAATPDLAEGSEAGEPGARGAEPD